MIAENIRRIDKEIEQACANSGRDREEVRLIAVSKTMPVSVVKEAYDCGIRDFGENRVQELIAKYDELPKDVNWHMIGHLQSNKVKPVIQRAKLIHSLDSIKLAEVIEHEAAKLNIVVDALLEVNVANEESKFGFKKEEILNSINNFVKYKNLRIRGLMTVAPYVSEAKYNESVFKTLKKMSVDISAMNIHNVYMDYLSMGMSNDYVVAISQGANFVRIGTSIFGER